MKLFGDLYYDAKKKTWNGEGRGWWISDSKSNCVRVNFESPFSLNAAKKYRITSSKTCGNAQFEVQNVTTDYFDIMAITYEEELCGVSFTAVGEQSAYFYDDRNLTNEESIADIYASSLLLDYEAKYGFIGLMGSASIKSKEQLESRVKELEEHNENLNEILEDDSTILLDEELKERIALNKVRMQRQGKLSAKGTNYYDSALEFGELWGNYCVHEQKKALNGCYVPLCTGGGPGIMEAAAKGARQQHAQVVAIDCQFGNDEFFSLEGSSDLYSNMRLRMNNFAIREGILLNYSHVILFWPGGFGTVWEACETLSKLQTKHLRKRRIKAIFVHSEYWKPFFEFVDHMREFGTVNSYGDRIKIPGVDDSNPDDAYIAEVVDTAQEAFEKTKAFVEELAHNGDLILRKETL